LGVGASKGVSHSLGSYVGHGDAHVCGDNNVSKEREFHIAEL